MKSWTRWLIVAAAVLLTACAGPQKIPLADNALKPGQALTVVEMPEVKNYFVYAPHPGLAFGLVGGAIAGAEMQSRADRLAAVVRSEKVEVNQIMTQKVVRHLEKSGYKVSVLRGAWVEKDGGHAIELETLAPGIDGVLVLTPRIVGYATPGLTDNYQPTVWAIASLFGSDRKTPIYQGFHSTGWKPPLDGWSYIKPCGAGMANFDAVLNTPQETARSLALAAEDVADSIAADLKR